MNARRRLAAILCSALVTAAVSATIAAPTAIATVGRNSTPGSYRPVTAARVLDTRTGLGAPDHPVGSAGDVTVTIAGHAGIPATGVSAVVLNLTATDSENGGYVTVYPAASVRPATSSLNVPAHHTVANLVVAKLGTNGSVTIHNGSSGSTDLLADVQGYYLAGAPVAAGTFGALSPARVLDTRTGVGAARRAVAPHGTVALRVTGGGGVPASGVSAVVLNVTVTSATSSGYLTAYPAGAHRPTASSLNHAAHVTVADLVVVRVGAGGVVNLYNGSSGAAQLVADVSGYYRSGVTSATGSFTPITPTRVMDTRTYVGANRRPLGAGKVATVYLPTTVAQPGTVSAVALTVTATGPSTVGHLTVYPSGYERPTASTLNFTRGQTVANLVVAPTDSANRVDIVNASSGPVNVVVDVAGYYRNPSLLWSTPQVTDPLQTELAHLSCPTATYCVGVDAAGNYTTYAAGSWSGAHLISTPATNQDLVRPLVSCATPTFCVAIDNQRRTSAFNGSTWTAQSAADPGHNVSGLACPTITRCVAIDAGGGATSYDGSAWSARTSLATVLHNLSCATATFCVAIDNAGHSYTYNGSAWSAAVSLGGLAVQQVSCAAPTFCLAFGGTQVATFDGVTWSAHHPVDSTSIIAITCASPTFCVAADAAGGYLTYDGSVWSSKQALTTRTLYDISCRSATQCIGIDGQGQAATYDGTSWSAPVLVQLDTFVNAISCSSSTFCVAVDGAGSAVTYDGDDWTPPVPVTPGHGLRGVSCPDVSFCVAVGDGVVATYDGGGWMTTEPFDTDSQPRAVSCASPTYCIAVDNLDRALTYNGTTWSAPVAMNAPGGTPTSISCPTTTFCAAAQPVAGLGRYDGVTWSAPGPVGANTESVSCVSATFCAAGGLTVFNSDGETDMFDGAAWHTTPPLGGAITSISCADQTLCLSSTWYGGTNIFNGATWTTVLNSTGVATQSTGSMVSCPSTAFCVLIGASNGTVSIGRQ